MADPTGAARFHGAGIADSGDDLSYGLSGRGFQPAAHDGDWGRIAARMWGNAPGRMCGAGVSGRRRGWLATCGSPGCAGRAATTRAACVWALDRRAELRRRVLVERGTWSAVAAACAWQDGRTPTQRSSGLFHLGIAHAWEGAEQPQESGRRGGRRGGEFLRRHSGWAPPCVRLLSAV